jgi:hypothetical protein
MHFLPLLATLTTLALSTAHILPRSNYPAINTTNGYVKGGPSDYRDGVTVYKYAQCPFLHRLNTFSDR